MKKILVANRGEIAMRIMRTAHEMGIKTVAIYSEIDRTMPFVRYADEAVCIGAAPSAQSYLRAEKIIEAARITSADAIHPGYGFLSENSIFAQTVIDAGLTFIGPSAYSLEVMGSKIEARNAVKKHGVPMVPGTDEPLTDIADAHIVANSVGYPVLVKASAGGGGKGLRVVKSDDELEEQIALAKSEALHAFGDDTIFIEKYVSSPRHIEVQILADMHGNCIYLNERECSIQRRHQKLVEEAPSSFVTPELRKAMGESAVAVAKSCRYFGAGTVEFLVDENRNFYFLEMNTRLQVEHCVTEEITGLDLVKEQFRIARGEKLSLKQEDVRMLGHSIELRVCAENPLNNFLPDTGTLDIYLTPKGPGVRVDDGYEQGQAIPIFYDSLIAKLVVHAPTREEAIARMVRAIDEYHIKGIQTTLQFGKWAVQHEAFRTGQFDTSFIEQYFKPSLLMNHKAETEEIAAMLAAHIWEKTRTQQPQNNQAASSIGAWKSRRS